MIKSTVSISTSITPKHFPKLMRGLQTGTIYLAHNFNAWSQTIDCTVLNPGENDKALIGNKNSYDCFLFEDFNGSVTLSNAG